MIRFDGNRILILDFENLNSRKLMLEIMRLGGKCSFAPVYQDAKNLSQVLDYDLILSSLRLPDGNLEDFMNWYKANIGDTACFAVIGDGPVEPDFHLPYIDKSQSFENILEQTNKLLFDFKDFEKSLSDLSDSNGIVYEIVADSKTVPVKPIEFNSATLLLGMEHGIAPGSIVKLRVTFKNFRSSEIITVIGVLGKHQADGQIFQINQDHLLNWNALKRLIDERQISITKFLNKVAGN